MVSAFSVEARDDDFFKKSSRCSFEKSNRPAAHLALNAMQAGAIDFIQKPFNADKFWIVTDLNDNMVMLSSGPMSMPMQH